MANVALVPSEPPIYELDTRVGVRRPRIRNYRDLKKIELWRLDVSNLKTRNREGFYATVRIGPDMPYGFALLGRESSSFKWCQTAALNSLWQQRSLGLRRAPYIWRIVTGGEALDLERMAQGLLCGL